ncbi:MAG TPA: hypothetical protein DC058_14625 [Planctomycetaceae bacterium]|nr:hypothetical protein [Planctomycetaceae bacterium]HBC62433.1 hypothetical protein [Planctomycetaceae bacterium]
MHFNKPQIRCDRYDLTCGTLATIRQNEFLRGPCMRVPAGREQPLVACCKPIGGFILGFSVPCTGRGGRRASR